jgi:type II secretion system protein J
MKRRAFTLIELVVAMAGCAIILVAIYSVFSRAVHLRDDATARTREVRVRGHALSILRDDLRNAWVSGGTTNPLAKVMTGSPQSPNGSFPGYLKFTTTTGRDDRADVSNEVQQVEYYIVTDPAATDRKAGMLVRTVDRDLLATMREKPPEETLLSGVESMDVSFFDGSNWQTSWSYSATGDPLPQAVRVRIQTATASVPFELLVPWNTQPSS